MITTCERSICDDLVMMCPEGGVDKISGRNYWVGEIAKEGNKHGMKLVVYFDWRSEKYVIFATNGLGHRAHFMNVEYPNGSSKPLDGRTLDQVREIFYMNKNPTKWFKENRKKNRAARDKALQDIVDETNYAMMSHQRTVRRLARGLGFSSGKANLPHGRSITRPYTPWKE